MNYIEDFISKIDTFTFEKRPEPIPPVLRPQWRIILILIILSYCNGKKASFSMLYALNWGIQKLNQTKFKDYITNSGESSLVLQINNDPFLIKALDLALGEGLIEITNTSGGDRVSLSQRGLNTVNELFRKNECFLEERRFLEDIKDYLKITKMEGIFKGR
ncbi:hypothetical protein SAMN02910340_00446 [Methanosarcina thermophila]|uniref:Uncharacterized protein n=1 Tax=Methanosarcina thermophila TaxID=2210 RepID=A0A1I6XEQ6_METTE|nr:hypothetical protein [Methanosarcina thermophila]SFT36848.1 hypothetical protein SAMN02910340_00446 [Methanosarcina thermophila]